MKNSYLILVILFWSLLVFSQPGKDGSYTVTGSSEILNKYSPVVADIIAGTNTLVFTPGPSFSLSTGDLIMIYQAQGATVNISNTASYGDVLNYNSAGFYQFNYVHSIVGSTITTQAVFTNSFSAAGKTQVVKVPQYIGLTVNTLAQVSAKAWQDTVISGNNYRFGGIVAIHSASIINNGKISATGAGFRGGQLFPNVGNFTGGLAYVSSVPNQGGEKGEGIFGFHQEYDNTGGRYGRGAPANGGGGGTMENSGGGGGANGFNGNIWTGEGIMVVNSSNPLTAWSLSSAYIGNSNTLTNSSGGGHGGYSWGNFNGNALTQGPGNTVWQGDSRREMGGLGGRPLGNIQATSRIYFGGGGGAVEANNLASNPGSSGGGIVYVVATSGITGTGLISSDALNAGNTQGCSCDGAPGGGGGGSVLIRSSSIAIATTQVVSAKGGNGGNQLPVGSPGNPANESEGPGGGGGGGFIAISTSGILPPLDVNGGLNGTTQAAAMTEMTSNGATMGAAGHTASLTGSFISFCGPPVSCVTIAQYGVSDEFLLKYENPSGELVLVTVASVPQDMLLVVIDNLGRIVSEHTILPSDARRVVVRMKESGVYYVQLWSANSLLKTGKLLVTSSGF